jgi:hypothetical protein
MSMSDWPRLLLSLGLIYAIFQGTASVLGSDRGQAGIVVGALVVVVTLAVDRVLLVGSRTSRPGHLGDANRS